LNFFAWSNKVISSGNSQETKRKRNSHLNPLLLKITKLKQTASKT
jgi:hypothetical protein